MAHTSHHISRTGKMVELDSGRRIAFQTARLYVERAMRIETTCLFPSFDVVSVYVIESGDGFIVHDGGGAVMSALQHGVTIEAVDAALQQQASRYGLQVKDGTLQCQFASKDWMHSAILSVANGTAAAANAALDGQH